MEIKVDLDHRLDRMIEPIRSRALVLWCNSITCCRVSCIPLFFLNKVVLKIVKDVHLCEVLGTHYRHMTCLDTKAH